MLAARAKMGADGCFGGNRIAGFDGVCDGVRRKTSTELVNFYDQRFEMNLADKEKQQLIALLNSLRYE